MVSWSASGDTRGSSVVLRRLMCPAQHQFILITSLIRSMTFVFSLTQMSVLQSWYVMLSMLLSISVCAAARCICACRMNVHVSAPYVTAGSTQGLYICLFGQCRLVFRISRPACLRNVLNMLSIRIALITSISVFQLAHSTEITLELFLI